MVVRTTRSGAALSQIPSFEQGVGVELQVRLSRAVGLHGDRSARVTVLGVRCDAEHDPVGLAGADLLELEGEEPVRLDLDVLDLEIGMPGFRDLDGPGDGIAAL